MHRNTLLMQLFKFTPVLIPLGYVDDCLVFPQRSTSQNEPRNLAEDIVTAPIASYKFSTYTLIAKCIPKIAHFPRNTRVYQPT